MTQDFGYDVMSRLVSVYSGADNESFQYEANGNRLAQTGTIDTVSATSNRLASSDSTRCGHDAMGNTDVQPLQGLQKGLPTYPSSIHGEVMLIDVTGF